MEFPDDQLVIVGAQRVQEVIVVAGSNHAIGNILNLAWGPNNFSPSMIWSWRTRGNSQLSLFLLSFVFYPLSSSFLSFFCFVLFFVSFFSFFFSEQLFF